LRRWQAAAGLALLAGCSGISENQDGVATVEIRLPTNFYLEKNHPVLIRAVARNASGDSVGAEFRWRSPDTTIAVDSARGLVTARADSGTARVQAALFGRDTVVSILDSLKFTLTATADTGFTTTADSITIRFDTVATSIGFKLEGGAARLPVRGRPISFAIVDPAPADTPAVVFASGRVRDSALTGTTGVAALTIRGQRGRPIPDRAVVEINAYRASGAKVPGSGHRVVVRFLHETP